MKSWKEGVRKERRELGCMCLCLCWVWLCSVRVEAVVKVVEVVGRPVWGGEGGMGVDAGASDGCCSVRGGRVEEVKEMDGW